MDQSKFYLISLEITALVLLFSIAFFIGDILGMSMLDLRKGEEVKQLDDYSAYELPTIVYDRNGKKLTEFFINRRKIVRYQEIPRKVIDAFVKVEDIRFYEHFGLDYPGIARAIVKNIIAGRIVEGGSSISQQLAKLFYTDRSRKLRRKINELWYTLQIEKRFTKNEILEKYLNKVYFGHGIYGVAEASHFFFRKNLKDLTTPEIAMLVSIPSAPLRYSPFRNLEAAKERQAVVYNKICNIDADLNIKVNLENQKFWNKIEKEILPNGVPSVFDEKEDQAPYFTEYVRIQAEKFIKNRLGKDKGFLYRGGLRIYTSLDLDLQIKAREYLNDQLKQQDRVFYSQNRNVYNYIKSNYMDSFNFLGLSFQDANYHFNAKSELNKTMNKIKKESDALQFISSQYGYENLTEDIHNFIIDSDFNVDNSLKAQGAIVCMEPYTGHVLTMVGGRKFTKRNQFNRVFAYRQPGSTFKVFVYGAAIQSKRFNPFSIIDRRSSRNVNFDFLEESTGIALKDALRLSLNDAALYLIRRLSPRRVINFASPMLGIHKSRLPENPSIALGSAEVSPYEMCRAISVYANGGMKVKPIIMTKIKDRNGKLIIDFEKEAKRNQERLISRQVASIMTQMLKQVINNGTGTKAKIKRPAAGKTGTTQNHKDAWFVGYTPDLATVVWVGFDRNMSLGNRQYGGDVAAPVWSRFMAYAHKDYPYRKFEKADLSGFYRRNLARRTSDALPDTNVVRKVKISEESDISIRETPHRRIYEKNPVLRPKTRHKQPSSENQRYRNEMKAIENRLFRRK